MLCVADCVADFVRLAIREPLEWQHIGNQIEPAIIFARADFEQCVVNWSIPLSSSCDEERFSHMIHKSG